MKKPIQSRADLKSEIARLSAEKQVAEHKLNTMIREFSTSMKPMNLIKSAFGSMKNDPDMKSIIKTRGLEALVGFVVSQLVFKKSNPFVRTAATVMGTSFASGIFGDDAINYVDKLKQLYRKFRDRKGKKDSGSFNEDDIYS
jgi:hypothetical protein